jgi:hypothetical protein
VQSFKADDTPGGKAFVRGGTINPSERPKPDSESDPRGRHVDLSYGCTSNLVVCVCDMDSSIFPRMSCRIVSMVHPRESLLLCATQACSNCVCIWMKVMIWYFVNDIPMVMTTLIHVVFVLDSLELT